MVIGRRDTWVSPYNRFVGQGPRALPWVRKNQVGPMWASAPTEAQQGVQWAGDRKGRPYGSVIRGAVRRAVGDAGPYEWDGGRGLPRPVCELVSQ